VNWVSAPEPKYQAALHVRPNFPGDLHGQIELGALVGFSERIAGHRAREAALRPDCQPIEIDAAACFVDPAFQLVLGLKRWPFAGDETENHSLVPAWHEAQWSAQ